MPDTGADPAGRCRPRRHSRGAHAHRAVRQAHAGGHLPGARRARRRAALLQVRELPAGRRVQVPRGDATRCCTWTTPTRPRRGHALVGQSRRRRSPAGLRAAASRPASSCRHAPAIKRRAVEGYGATGSSAAPDRSPRARRRRRVDRRDRRACSSPVRRPAASSPARGPPRWNCIEQVPALDAVVAPVGGGGLLGDRASPPRMRAGIRVIGVEPRGGGRRGAARIAAAILPATPDDDRRRPAHLPRRGRSRSSADARRGDRHRHRGRDRRGDAIRLGAAQDRHRAVVRRAGRALLARRPASPGGASASSCRGGNVDLDRLPWQA